MLNRRQFVGQLVLAAAAMASGCSSAAVVRSTTHLDRFGGWRGRVFEATGYFRLENDGRWWFVTPEGHAFLSFGINHLHAYWWRASYNRDFWSRALGIDYTDTRAFDVALARRLLDDIRAFGFNTIGVHNTIPELTGPAPVIPYIKQVVFVDIPGWKGSHESLLYPDVFSPAFEDHCETVASQEVRPLRDDPFVLGYAMTDIPILTELDTRMGSKGPAVRGRLPTWPRVLRNLGPDAPGKWYYVQTMRELYENRISRFNLTYGTRFRSFRSLLRARDWRTFTSASDSREMRDNRVFLRRVVDRYYRVARDVIRRHDPNHLFFGDKLNGDTDSADTVIDITSRYTDLCFYQIYDPYRAQAPWLDKWSARTGKPFYNGDSSYGLSTEMTPRPYGPVTSDPRQRAAWAREFFEKAFARPDFVGWSWCGFIETWKTMPGKERYQHGGIVDVIGKPYPLIQKTLQDLTGNIYRIAASGS